MKYWFSQKQLDTMLAMEIGGVRNGDGSRYKGPTNVFITVDNARRQYTEVTQSEPPSGNWDDYVLVATDNLTRSEFLTGILEQDASEPSPHEPQ